MAVCFTSCKSETEKAEIVTNNYIRFVDSVTDKTAVNAATAKYEAFGNSILHQKAELEPGIFPTQ